VAKELFENMDYATYRRYYQMHIVVDTPPPAPCWPDDLVLKPFDPECDLEAVYLADIDCSKDHHGYIEESFEIDFPRFHHYFINTENYDPTLWFIVWDRDEIAGISICRPYSRVDKNMGWVSSFGVRRPWRKKGLGLALLQHSFGEFFKRGKKKVGLTVDAGSLTGALDLYKKAGMSVFSQFDKNEKELRAGEEISLQKLEKGKQHD
jgi:mycothiol synthase